MDKTNVEESRILLAEPGSDKRHILRHVDPRVVPGDDTGVRAHSNRRLGNRVVDDQVASVPSALALASDSRLERDVVF